MKKHLILFILIYVTILFTLDSYSDDLEGNIPESIYGLTINQEYINSGGYLVYGSHIDVIGNQYKNISGEYVLFTNPKAIPRYLGYDMSGNPYTNIDFPNDADSGRQVYEKDWIKNPWNLLSLNIIRSDYNNYDSFKPLGIQYLQTMVAQYNTKQNNAWQGFTGDILIDYLNIQSPPTDYCPGSAIGWHISNSGQVWYQTFSIPALKKLEHTITEEPPIDNNEIIEDNTIDIENEFTINITSNEFSVLDAIPSGEEINIEVFAKPYLLELKTQQVTGYEDYTVTVHKDFIVMMNDGSELINTISKSYSITRRYGYTKVENYSLYMPIHINIEGEFLETNGFESDINTNIPNISYKQTGGMDAPSYSSNVYLTTEYLNEGDTIPTESECHWYQYASYEVDDIDITHDYLRVGDKTIISSSSGVQENNLQVDNQTIFDVDDLMISRFTKNGCYRGYGVLEYEEVASSSNVSNEIMTFQSMSNDMNVLTPVTCNIDFTDHNQYDQRFIPQKNETILTLDRSFNINFQSEGTHLPYRGYGSRAYNKYILSRILTLPFDVYIGTGPDGTFIPANQSINVQNDSIELYIPIWIIVGEYEITAECTAYNYPNGNYGYENNANINGTYKTVDTQTITIQGRLFDFTITDITDPQWELFFRENKDSTIHTGKVFKSGNKDWNGNTNLLSGTRFVLPAMEVNNDIRNASSIKLGYTFRFDIKTMGQFYKENDSLEIIPNFFQIDANGQNRKDIDLYYMKEGIPIQLNEENRININMRFNNSFRNIDKAALKNTVLLEHRYKLTQESLIHDIDSYVNNRLNAKEENIGNLLKLKLSYKQRLFCGGTAYIPESVNADKAYASVQKWYGEYYLPATTLMVPKGYDIYENRILTEDADFWIKKGYLGINLKLYVYKNGESTPYLTYHAPICNQWEVEGFNVNKNTFQLDYGDVILFNVNHSSNDDLEVRGNR